MAAEVGPRHRVEVGLLADKSAAEPGKTITVAVQERIEPGWHTYWINPGDSASRLRLNGTCRKVFLRDRSFGQFPTSSPWDRSPSMAMTMRSCF